MNLSSDRPISAKEEDQFQRYGFAKRIADTIESRKNQSCIVVGLYGAWGEGKTSMINFIENELSEKEDIICIKFNAWRYGDENSLLIQFYQKLAESIESKLKTQAEIIGDFLGKYGKIASMNIPGIGNIGGSIENIGKAIGETSIETLKERISGGFKNSDKNLVIFIDDIDRLDKNEIYSLFRLVKLNADFENTTYVLSFDEDMVSAAIGERFGKSDQTAGRSFLEKIIQVPIHIPPTHPDVLMEYCYNLIKQTLFLNKIELSEEEEKRFLTQMRSYALDRLNTPRLAVRYNNSIFFSIPLLEGEVNIVDLLLVEAIKIFYPKYHSFIRMEHSYFTSSDYGLDLFENSEVSLNEKLSDVESNLSMNEKKNVENMILGLFPHLEKSSDTFFLDQNPKVDPYKEKRISAPSYFNKYFTYSILKGEISDIEFNRFISASEINSPTEISTRIEQFVRGSSPQKFLSKLYDHLNDLTWKSFTCIAESFCLISHVFMRKSQWFGSFDLLTDAAKFIFTGIANHDNSPQRFEFSENIIKLSELPYFGYEIMKWLLNQYSSQVEIFEDSDKVKLFIVFKNKILNDSAALAFYEKFSYNADFIFFVLEIWNNIDKEQVDLYVKDHIKKSTEGVENFLWPFVHVMTYGNYNRCKKFNFDENNFNRLKVVVDVNFLYEIIQSKENEIDGNDAKFIDDYYINLPNSVRLEEFTQNKTNVLRQFKFWYDKDKEFRSS